MTISFLFQRIITYLTANNSQKMREMSVASKARVYVYTVREKPNSLLVRGTFNQIEAVRQLLKQLVIIDEESNGSNHQQNGQVGSLPKPKV